MPQYRKLWVKTAISFDLQDMPDDFTRLLWVLLPLGATREGTYVWHAGYVRSKVMPLRSDATDKMFLDALTWYENRGMIMRYQVAGRDYFWITNWEKYQGDTTKEAKSDLPPVPAEVKKDSGEGFAVLSQSSGESLAVLSQSSASDADADAYSSARADARADGKPPTAQEVAVGNGFCTFTEPDEKKGQAGMNLFNPLAALCKYDLAVIGLEQQKQLYRVVGKLLNGAHATPKDLDQFREFWDTDWRGKKGQPPTPAQVLEKWGAFREWQQGSGKNESKRIWA